MPFCIGPTLQNQTAIRLKDCLCFERCNQGCSVQIRVLQTAPVPQFPARAWVAAESSGRASKRRWLSKEELRRARPRKCDRDYDGCCAGNNIVDRNRRKPHGALQKRKMQNRSAVYEDRERQAGGDGRNARVAVEFRQQ